MSFAMPDLKFVVVPLFRHSGKSRARSEALSLSSVFIRFWMPPHRAVPDRLLKSGMTIWRLLIIPIG
jgi:hypothetical protein